MKREKELRKIYTANHWWKLQLIPRCVYIYMYTNNSGTPSSTKKKEKKKEEKKSWPRSRGVGTPRRARGLTQELPPFVTSARPHGPARIQYTNAHTMCIYIYTVHKKRRRRKIHNFFHDGKIRHLHQGPSFSISLCIITSSPSIIQRVRHYVPIDNGGSESQSTEFNGK